MDVNIKTIFVVDASYVLAFLLEEGSGEVESLFEKYTRGEVRFIAPSLLKYEVGNSLRTKWLRKKLKAEKTQKIYQFFLNMEIAEEEVDDLKTMQLALSKNLTFYDASYLFLAKKYKIPLLTLDTKLK